MYPPGKDHYPTLSTIPLGPRVRIRRDGVEVAVVADANAAFTWLVRNTNQSASYALMYDGYTCEPVAEEEPA